MQFHSFYLYLFKKKTKQQQKKLLIHYNNYCKKKTVFKDSASLFSNLKQKKKPFNAATIYD